MGSGKFEEENWPAPSIAGAKLADSPILFIVVTHKAFRAELASLRHVATEAAESGDDVRRELLVDLGRRLEFLKLVADYHTVAEDEVIFLALDAKVKNVVPKYSLEHSSIDFKFSSIFDHLDVLMKKDEDTPEMFQALISSISTLQAMICHHVHKEEEQVFPLLMEKFTPEEQSQLVWQYMCSVPVMILEEFFPRMVLHLTSDEKLDVLNCITLIIPKESLLQEVVISWIQNEKRSSGAVIYGKGYRLLNGLSSLEDIHKLFPLQLMEPCAVQTNDVEVPIFNGIYFWHAAMRRDLYQIIEKLFQIRSSNSFSSLPPVIVQLRFIADVLFFYSNFLDKIFNPLLIILSKNSLSPFGPLVDESHIKGLQNFLFYEHQDSAKLRSYVEMLCRELESLVMGLRKNLMFLKTEVLASFSKICTREMQLYLLYTFFHMMPLGLLRCTVPWFSAHLTENQSNSLLKSMKPGCPAVTNSFTSILYVWVHISCSESGKKSIDIFRQNLEDMFKGRRFYLANQNRQETVISDQVLKSNLTAKTNKSLANINYPSASGMNLHIFFTQMFQKNLAETDHATSPSLESRPMDLIFYIHSGLLKDLDYLVSLSAKLAANLGYLSDFKKCFKLLCIIYQMHCTSKDEIAFPDLESKGALQNISSSNCIDRKMVDEYISKTSKILEEVCEFHDHEGNRLQIHKLCLKLHETCMSMHKVLSNQMYREEVEVFPLLIGRFSTEEEEKIVGHMLGGTGAEILQEMIPWLMAHLTYAEKHAVMSTWLRIARYTKFDEWLSECWESRTEYNVSIVEELKNVEIPGRCPSYGDDLELTFGCKHYKRNCKLVAPCCNKLFPCIRCHDELTTDHSVDRKAITKMMCMKCLVIQPIRPECTSQYCSGFSMGKYYCRICKLFDDERQIYHCPYCNLCRLGKGLGIDFFHSMEHNYCISRALFERLRGEKCPEDDCPICHEYMFTLNSPVKELPCGHFMHSSCFQDYISSSYICPVCSKSMGNMQVYFEMLDAFLAEENTPEEYSGQVQDILCNECEKRGTASFHQLYHKCPYCGSYNTMLL